MTKLYIRGNSSPDCTVITNTFIDYFMIEANGEFVKIYLYLLRCLSNPDQDISISSIADKLQHTEKDVKRALKYWEKMKLLKLELSDANKLTGIYLLPVKTRSETAPREESTAKKQVAASVIPEAKPAPVLAAKPIPEKITYTADKLRKLKENEEIQQLLFIAEQYMGKTLTATEVSTILYFYEDLQMAVDLIEFLIEYSVSKGSKSIRYMEKVALAWKQENIKTVAEAKASANLHSRSSFAVMNVFGIKGRNPAEPELNFIKKWTDEYGFSLEIISEACRRTISQTHQPSFEYTDSILRRWKSKDVKHLDDIKQLDLQHKKNKEAVPEFKPKPSASNKFNNFKQTTYNYSELEKELLK